MLPPVVVMNGVDGPIVSEIFGIDVLLVIIRPSDGSPPLDASRHNYL